MYDDIDDEPNDSLSMSFLDVISCGMLSAVFLALIFSIIGQKPPTLLQTHDFIQITFSIPKDDLRVWNLALTPPGAKEEYSIPLKEFNLDSIGRLINEDGTGASEEVRELSKYGIRLFGFQRRFYDSTPEKTAETPPLEMNANLIKNSDEDARETRMAVISNPTPGVWKARVFVRDPGEFESDVGGSVSDFSVNLSNNKSVKVEAPDAEGRYSWEY